MRLKDIGIRGNGHMLMIERNNLDIAAVLGDWIAAEVETPANRLRLGSAPARTTRR